LTGNVVPDRGSIELNTRRESVRFEFPRGWGWQQSRFTPDNLARLGLGRTWQDIRLFDTQSLADNIAVYFSSTQRKLVVGGVWESVYIATGAGT
jgi:ABC-type branched-subunit amino acid transport system ATPase component